MSSCEFENYNDDESLASDFDRLSVRSSNETQYLCSSAAPPFRFTGSYSNGTTATASRNGPQLQSSTKTADSKFHVFTTPYRCNGSCKRRPEPEEQISSSAAVNPIPIEDILWQESLFGPLLVLSDERLRESEARVPHYNLYFSRTGRAASAFWNSMSQRISQQDDELNRMFDNSDGTDGLRCRVLITRERIRLLHASAVLHFYLFLNATSTAESSNELKKCRDVLRDILQREPHNLLALLHLAILNWCTSGAGHEAAAAAAAVDEPREWALYNQCRADAYARAVLHSELGFVYSKLGPDFQGAALDKYETAAGGLQWHCSSFSASGSSSDCELRVLHLFICFGYALCAHRNADLHDPRARATAARRAELHVIFAKFLHCTRELFALYTAVKPFDSRALLLFAQSCISHWKLYRHLDSIACQQEATSDAERFTIGFEDLAAICKCTYDEFTKRCKCAHPVCFKTKRRLCAGCYPNEKIDTNTSELSDWNVREKLIARCPHVLCPDVVAQLCVWKAIRLVIEWDEYSLCTIGKLIRMYRICLYSLDRDFIFRIRLSARHFPNFEYVRRNGRLWNDERFVERRTLQYLVYAERYLLWAQRVRASATSAHHLALVYIDACRATHLSARRSRFEPSTSSSSSSSLSSSSSSPAFSASAGAAAVGVVGSGTSNADSDAASTRISSRAPCLFGGLNAVFRSNRGPQSAADSSHPRNHQLGAQVSVNSDVSVTSELDQLEYTENPMTPDQIFSDDMDPKQVERMLCQRYETHCGCELLKRARDLLENASRDFDEEIAVILNERLIVEYKLLAPSHGYQLEGDETPKDAVLRIHRAAADKFRDESAKAALQPLLHSLADIFRKLKDNPRTLAFDSTRYCERYGVMLALLGDTDGAIEVLDEAVRKAIAANALARGAILFGAKLLAWLMELKRPAVGQLECIHKYSPSILQQNDSHS